MARKKAREPSSLNKLERIGDCAKCGAKLEVTQKKTKKGVAYVVYTSSHLCRECEAEERRLLLRNVIDRIRTIHPSAKIETKDDGMEVSFGAEKVVVRVEAARVGVGADAKSLAWFSRREFENEVMDHVHGLWKKHEATLPKRPSSSGGSSSYSGRGGGDDDVSATGFYIEGNDSDDGDSDDD